jgi:hypothetical protein
MGRRLLCDVEEPGKVLTRADQVPLFDSEVFERKARQTEIVDPALTRVKAGVELDRQGLDRLTWRDYVEFGDVGTPIGQQPEWKHRFAEGTMLELTPKRRGDPPVSAVVIFSSTFPVDERLPLSVQVRVSIHGRAVDVTCVPTTAIRSVLGKLGA